MLEKLLAKTLVFALLMGFLLSGCSSASKPEVINSSKFGPMVQVYETIIVPDGAAAFNSNRYVFDIWHHAFARACGADSYGA